MDANKRNFLAAMIPVAVGIPLGLFSSVSSVDAQRPIPPPSAQQGQAPLHQDPNRAGWPAKAESQRYSEAESAANTR